MFEEELTSVLEAQPNLLFIVFFISFSGALFLSILFYTQQNNPRDKLRVSLGAIFLSIGCIFTSYYSFIINLGETEEWFEKELQPLLSQLKEKKVEVLAYAIHEIDENTLNTADVVIHFVEDEKGYDYKGKVKVIEVPDLEKPELHYKTLHPVVREVFPDYYKTPILKIPLETFHISYTTPEISNYEFEKIYEYGNSIVRKFEDKNFKMGWKKNFNAFKLILFISSLFAFFYTILGIKNYKRLKNEESSENVLQETDEKEQHNKTENLIEERAKKRVIRD